MNVEKVFNLSAGHYDKTEEECFIVLASQTMKQIKK